MINWTQSNKEICMHNIVIAILFDFRQWLTTLLNGIAISFLFPNDIPFFLGITSNQQRLELTATSLRGLTFKFNYRLMHFMTRDSPSTQPGISFHGFCYRASLGTSVWKQFVANVASSLPQHHWQMQRNDSSQYVYYQLNCRSCQKNGVEIRTRLPYGLHLQIFFEGLPIKSDPENVSFNTAEV